MKKLLYIFVLLFPILLSPQSGNVTYSVEYINDKKHEFTKKFKDEMELMEFTLSYNVQKSFFKKEKNIPKDNLFGQTATSLLSATGDYIQTSNNKTYSQKTIKNIDYQVDRSDRMKNWELTNETTKINNYTCYKAILTEYNTRSETYFKTIAWYTPEIPVGYGPIGYGGLPGLILQLEYKKSVFRAKAITLNPKSLKISSLRDGEIISYKRMIELMRAARKVTPD